MKSDYPNLYSRISADYNLDDPTFHASFKVTYCNFKRTPILTASNSIETKEYKVDMSDKVIKSREIKKFFELCAADCANAL
ncbi:MAG: hypothetical protein ACPGYY_03745 [Bacteroidia bacterium]